MTIRLCAGAGLDREHASVRAQIVPELQMWQCLGRKRDGDFEQPSAVERRHELADRASAITVGWIACGLRRRGDIRDRLHFNELASAERNLRSRRKRWIAEIDMI